MKKWFYILILFALLTISGCNDGKSDSSVKEKELTFLSNFTLDTFDPHLSWNTLRAGITETLVNLSDDGELYPGLAIGWEIENNGQTWILTIRDNVTFHNGVSLTAETVKASIERNLEVSEAMKLALKIERMEADGQVLTIYLNESLYSFPSELTHPNTSIVEVGSENLDSKPIGTGPFQLKSFEPGSKAELVKFDDYWDGEPKLDRVHFIFNADENARTAALQSGDADIVYRPALESLRMLSEHNDIETIVSPSSRSTMLLYNTDKEIVSDVNVRKAISSLVDREQIVSDIMSGNAVVASGPFLKNTPFATSEDEKAFNQQEAKEYLEAAGFESENGKMMKDGEELILKLVTYSYRPDLPLIAQYLESNAKEIGLSVEILIVENIDEQLNSDDWDLAIYSANTNPRGDASYYLNAVLYPGGSVNFKDFNDTKLTETIDTFNQTENEEERIELAKEAVSIASEQEYISFLVHPSNYAAYKSNVKNYSLNIGEFYMLTKDIDVVE
ncbi:hypothetical protein AJ85_02425 [Alkalihalobacillus alcalophilus ATCC 27647 = CGMCC 1.3604]|uniref:Solute-binding protein family 5 domain-containing protein n=1 Tax=Alkalihalobacillus alcalophilus ATCC 27647 = CGMCC 1.3604 TaxID=1218173 RepID=A0A094WMR7_ALKAL|nr:nickel ABC transporter substrate-binding protein [Alkalihalobacillus alcalophilus]KGA99064.1 hypothetical protein BALCAV_0201135 [Alkalihalobacillus alcalophilus ATCC 27647 = CGMCC 1.3604]MED1560709.1 ABC transporter substrate-binding protein [Alkalihalobacillus alcalophilus]THG88559.1 hypothetical protein AJ85_02425 [Alkalihalobacillus alcalophilus ATCC 27647 = CGMCC 1.3604]